MVNTRAKSKLNPENSLELETTKKNNNKSIKIKLVPAKVNKKKNVSKDSDNESEESDYDSEDDIFNESYYDFIPSSILENKKLKKKIDKIVTYIDENTISLEQILKSKIRKKHKVELFELFIIYDNISIMSDEKKAFRNKIYNLFKVYENQYESYLENKQEIKLLESNQNSNELFNLQLQIVQLNTSLENKKVIYSKYLELLEKKNDIDEEYYKLKNWIQLALKLPFDNLKTVSMNSEISIYLQKIKSILDEELYGMSKVKEQLLLFIHNKLINPNVKGCCLGLVGAPGVGKTTIARCLAKIMDIPFSQITFGGINSAEFIRGYDYTYVGSKPGEIVRCLTRMNYKNGIIFFDEYEKISKNPDINACLLHITDFSQNNEFRDNYLSELSIDLSSIWFIYSMNELPQDHALKDRIFFINVDGYNIKDQVQILCNYLLPKHLTNLNLKKNSIIFNPSIAEYFIQKYSNQEKGVRTIEKQIKDLINKIAFLVNNQNTIQTSFNVPDKYLPIQYPFSVNCEIIDCLLQNSKNFNQEYLNMYM